MHKIKNNMKNTGLLTYDEFLEKYTPEYNQILLRDLQSEEDTDSTLPEDMCSYGGCMYEKSIQSHTTGCHMLM